MVTSADLVVLLQEGNEIVIETSSSCSQQLIQKSDKRNNYTSHSNADSFDDGFQIQSVEFEFLWFQLTVDGWTIKGLYRHFIDPTPKI
jgi:hypothetical protein